ncbi:MAG: hypothetical protein IKJ14_02350 [Clostridia bacterium]|nr:hypothetical protein [Clostridia bacterium]
MIKSKSIWVLIISFIVVAFISIAIIFNNLDARSEFTNSVKIDGSGYAEKEIEVRNLQLHPNESKSYTIEVAPEFGGDYEISINYQEIKDGGLKEFVTVSFSVDGKQVQSSSLKNLLDGKSSIVILQNFSEDKPLKLTVTYIMPYEVGNEAQGAYADFDVTLIFDKK